MERDRSGLIRHHIESRSLWPVIENPDGTTAAETYGRIHLADKSCAAAKPRPRLWFIKTMPGTRRQRLCHLGRAYLVQPQHLPMLVQLVFAAPQWEESWPLGRPNDRDHAGGEDSRGDEKALQGLSHRGREALMAEDARRPAG